MIGVCGTEGLMRPSESNGRTLTVLTRSRMSCYPHCIGLSSLFWLFSVSLLLAAANEYTSNHGEE